MGELKLASKPSPQAESKAMLKEVVSKNARNMWRRSARIAVPIASIGGFCADVLAPLGPIVIYLAILTVILAVISGFVWYGVKKRQIRAALADGVIDADEYERINNRGTWPTLFSFSAMASALLLAFAGAQKVFAESETAKGLFASKIPAIADWQQQLLGLVQSNARIEKSIEGIDKKLTGLHAISDKLDSLNAKFDKLAEGGSLVENPKSPEEYYSNARLYELKVDYAKARQSYLEYMKSDLPYVDPHIYFSGLLKLQDGRQSAYETYGMFVRGKQPAPILARALLQEREPRLKGLLKLAEDYPEFAPIHYYLSREYAAPEGGQQTLENMKKEKEALEKLHSLSERGLFTKYFLDKRMAVQFESEAMQRAQKFEQMSDEYLNAPAKITVLPGKRGWEGVIVLPFDGAEAFVKLPGGSDYHSLGFQDRNNPVNGKPMPVTTVDLAKVKTRGVISIKYRDNQGTVRGPFDTPFDPVGEFVKFAKRLMAKTPQELMPVYTFKGKRTVVTAQMMMFRDAIAKVTLGPSPGKLEMQLKLPPATNEFIIHEFSSDSPFTTQPVPEAWENIYMRIEYADGSSSEAMALH